MGTETGRRSETTTAPRGNVPLAAVLGAIWIAFTIFTIAVILDFGVVGFVEAALENGATTQISIDLVLSIATALVFIRRDAQERNLPFWPYFAVTVMAGSIGLVAYLIHRTWRGR